MAIQQRSVTSERLLEMEALAHDLVTHPDFVPLVESWLKDETLRHDFLKKCELIREQVIMTREDAHVKQNEESGAW